MIKMNKEYSFTIPSHNYGEIDFSYTDDSDKCLILFIIGNNINAIDFPAITLLERLQTVGQYLAQRGILLSLEEVEQIRVAFFGKGSN